MAKKTNEGFPNGFFSSNRKIYQVHYDGYIAETDTEENARKIVAHLNAGNKIRTRASNTVEFSSTGKASHPHDVFVDGDWIGRVFSAREFMLLPLSGGE